MARIEVPEAAPVLAALPRVCVVTGEIRGVDMCSPPAGPLAALCSRCRSHAA